MSDERRNPEYTPYHPKWYRRRIPIFWWLGHRRYTKFIARELTSVFVAYVAVLLLVQLWTLGRGEAAYGRFWGWLSSPPVVAFHAFVWIAVLFHTVTWLSLAPKALVVRVARRRVPDAWVVAAQYGAWLVASAAVAGLLL